MYEFDELTPRELYFAFKEKMNQEEFHFQTDMERMRLQTMLLINIHLKKADQYKDPKRFLPFPWEKKDEWKNPNQVQKQSVEEMKSILLAISKSSKSSKK